MLSEKQWRRTVQLAFPLEEHQQEESASSLFDLSSDSSGVEEERVILHGVKSLELGVGEGVAVQQALELELQGKVGERGYVIGALRDQDFPVEGGGQSSSLKEIDWMWLRIGVDSSWIHWGDQHLFWGERGELSHFERNQQGVGFQIKSDHFYSEGSWGGGRSRHRHVEIELVDGVSEGYDLQVEGAIVPRSTRVSLNGEELDPSDYRVDEAAGVLDLLQTKLPSSVDRLTVEYQETLHNQAGDWGHFASQLRSGAWSIGGGLSWMRESRDLSAEGDSLSPEALLHLRSTGALGRGGYWELEWARSLELLDTQEALDCDSGCGDGVRWNWSTPSSLPLILSGRGRYLMGLAPWMRLDDPALFEQQWALSSDTLHSHLLTEQKAEWRGKEWSLFSGLDWLLPDDTTTYQVVLNRWGLIHTTSKSSQNSFVEWGGWLQPDQPMVERRRWESNAAFKAGGFSPSAKSRIDLWSRGGIEDLRHLLSTISIEKRWAQFQWSAGADARLRQQFIQENWVDSLRQISAHQRSLFLYDAGELSLNSAWQQTEIGGSSGDHSSLEIFDRTMTKGGGYFTANLRHRRTLAQPLIRSYRRVADGAGNVIYDSLVGRWIEGVDLGDYLFDGWVRDTTLERELRVMNGWGCSFYQPIGALVNVQKGFLNDLSMEGETAWDVTDSLNRHWLTPSSDALFSAVEGRWLRLLGLRWTPPLYSSQIKLSVEKNLVRSTGVSSGNDEYYIWRLSNQQQFTTRWSHILDLAREEVQRDFIEWNGWRGDYQVEYRRKQWSGFPLFHWSSTQGDVSGNSLRALLLRPGVRGQWRFDEEKNLFAEYQWNRLWTGELTPPWEMSEGYRKGITHRWECGGNWQAADALQINGSIIIQRNPDGEYRKKVRVEGRGVF